MKLKIIIPIIITILFTVSGCALQSKKEAAAPNHADGQNITLPSLGKSYAMVMNFNGKVLYQENADVKAVPASLTKIMTALLVLDNGNLQTRVKISQRAANIGDASAHMKAGEVYTREELLYGLLLPSGNDSAIALAESVAGNEDNFVKMMNAKSQGLELAETHFSDAAGVTPSDYSSAHDLALLTIAAMQSPEFRKIVATRSYFLPATINHGSHDWKNFTSSFLNEYSGSEGVKTGWTTPAGFCVIGAAKRGQTELVAVVMHSDSFSNAWQDAETLLNAYF
jgi:D-alanyl-D-alanine carboxypeptidase (penicillin-binding protein 5/6)